MTATAKTVADSLTLMTEQCLPPHANVAGTIFGGQIMAWMDICAAICSQRHAGAVCVTAAVDELTFQKPILVGHVVRLEARLTAVFKTSLEVEVTVQGENASTGELWPCVHALMTFVAINPDGTKRQVPDLVLSSDEERARHAGALARKQTRLALKNAG